MGAVAVQDAPNRWDLGRLETGFAKYGNGSKQPFQEWRAMLEATAAEGVERQLETVNGFFNRRLRFDDDAVIWGASDYWATPFESLAQSAGDCEDFALAKYFSLLLLGVPNEKLRLIYVKARIGGPSSTVQQAHMVLAFYQTPQSDPLVLDNLISEIRPAAQRTDLLPVFSFNSQAIFIGVTGTASAGPGGIGRLSRWADLVRRVQADGF